MNHHDIGTVVTIVITHYWQIEQQSWGTYLCEKSDQENQMYTKSFNQTSWESLRMLRAMCETKKEPVGNSNENIKQLLRLFITF
jgi:hypothetical protein